MIIYSLSTKTQQPFLAITLCKGRLSFINKIIAFPIKLRVSILHQNGINYSLETLKYVNNDKSKYYLKELLSCKNNKCLS